MEVKKNENVVYHVLKSDGKNVGSVSLRENWTIEACNGGFMIVKKLDRNQDLEPSTSRGFQQQAIKAEHAGQAPDFKTVLPRVRAEPEARPEIKSEVRGGDSTITVSSDSFNSDSEEEADRTTCLIHGYLVKKRFKK